MGPEYMEEIEKLRLKFKIIYGASFVLLLIIFTAVWLYYSPPGGAVDKDIIVEANEKTALLNQDALLHEGMLKLDALDLNYARLLASSPDSASLANLDNLNNSAFIDFSNLIDRMNNQKNLFTVPSNAQKSAAIINTFITALNLRRSNDSLRMAYMYPAGNKDSANNLLILQLQINAQAKEDTIRNLLSQLNFQDHLNKYNLPVQQIVQPVNNEVESFPSPQSVMRRQKDSIRILLAAYKTLISDNNSLTDQLNKLTSNKNKQDDDPMHDQVNALNGQIDNLNAELILQRIDCNLTRANGKDIIYNARQRKDLLQESLASLKTLSTSNNPLIQRRVKNKLQLLQNIASTVRD